MCPEAQVSASDVAGTRGDAGAPMVWYSQHWVAFLMYAPVSVAATLWVQVRGKGSPPIPLLVSLA